uniref:Retrotransposon gag domain-containing protein n=2 Tax=Cajanus cajan TaxID=3821 RepID=A0A151S4Y8_CAJCA|nr:hypothetical protein KK1_028383 [Cajanus cajan]
MHQNQQLHDWESFIQAIEARFGPSAYQNHEAELLKLKQTSTVAEFQQRFEKLSNRVFGLSPVTLRNCFISGLTPAIQHELAILRPVTVHQAMGLARLVEDKLRDSKPKFSSRFSPPPTTDIPSSVSHPSSSSHATPTPSFPIKKLSNAQMQDRRSKGLCFNCDENFYPGHKCTQTQFLLLLAEEESHIVDQPSTPCEDINTMLIENQPLPIHLQLSPQALTSQPSPQTLRFKGSIDGLGVTILIDTGSSHNIMQPRIAH